LLLFDIPDPLHAVACGCWLEAQYDVPMTPEKLNRFRNTQGHAELPSEKTIDAKLFFHDKRHYLLTGACQSARASQDHPGNRP
jgi:hypothetical protein